MATAVSAVPRIHDTTIRLTRDDITLLEVDAFVFYAAHDLTLGAGYGTAISGRGGPEVQRELKELGPVETGGVVVSGAGKLPADHIIHAVGPRFKEPDIEGKLRLTMKNVLDQAVALGVRRLAFPPMGVGYYGIPAALSARVMFEVLAERLDGSGIQEVVVSLLDSDQYAAFEAVLNEMGGTS